VYDRGDGVFMISLEDFLVNYKSIRINYVQPDYLYNAVDTDPDDEGLVKAGKKSCVDVEMVLKKDSYCFLSLN
jgi:hypothetical protein